jgi:hypothetical protein
MRDCSKDDVWASGMLNVFTGPSKIEILLPGHHNVAAGESTPEQLCWKEQSGEEEDQNGQSNLAKCTCVRTGQTLSVCLNGSYFTSDATPRGVAHS